MNFLRESEKEIVIIKVNLSRATMKEASELKKIILDEIDKDTKKIVIDFSSCEFMDSTFISVLITSLKNITKVKGQLILANVKSEALSLMELTGTSKVFSFSDSVKEAVKKFQ
jgi:anti-anti-sigma factor